MGIQTGLTFSKAQSGSDNMIRPGFQFQFSFFKADRFIVNTGFVFHSSARSNHDFTVYQQSYGWGYDTTLPMKKISPGFLDANLIEYCFNIDVMMRRNSLVPGKPYLLIGFSSMFYRFKTTLRNSDPKYVFWDGSGYIQYGTLNLGFGYQYSFGCAKFFAEALANTELGDNIEGQINAPWLIALNAGIRISFARRD